MENTANEHLSLKTIKFVLCSPSTINRPYRSQSIENVMIQWLVT